MYAISTVILIVGSLISYFQWRTAQQKVALDILDSRYKIYEDLRTAVSNYLTSAQFSVETQGLFMAAQSRARFHFGKEVEVYLEQVRRDILTTHLFDHFAERPNANIDDQVARLDRINAFYAEIDKMFIPYMRLDQRMPLWWWSHFSELCKRWTSTCKKKLFSRME
jgi:hypothetical protein